MKTLASRAAYLTLLIVATGMLSACESAMTEDDFVPGEVLVRLVSHDAKQEVRARIDALDLEWKEYLEHLGVAVIGVPGGQEELWAGRLQQEPGIHIAQLNRNVERRQPR